MARLVKYQKEVILASMMAHAYQARWEVLFKRARELALRVYCDRYNTAQRKLMEQLEEGWLPSESDIDINLEGESHYLPFNGCLSGSGWRSYLPGGSKWYPRESEETVYRRVPYHHHRSSRHTVRGEDLKDDLRSFFQDVAELAEETKRISLRAWSVIDSCRSTKTLRELWPETAPFLREFEEAGSAPLPAVLPEGLNEALELPVEEVE